MGVSLVPGRGVVREEHREFEVVLADGRKLYRGAGGRILFTQPHANLLARTIGGKLWKMERTVYSVPRAFNAIQQDLFEHGLCCYITQPARRPADAGYCREESAPRADYGYCAKHKSQLLAAEWNACWAWDMNRHELMG